MQLDDKYTLDRGRVYLTGIQALVRLPMEQVRRDQKAGLRTGAFISGFRPNLNEAVQSLAALPDGRLAVGGKFTTIDGTAVTGLAVLNATTGASPPAGAPPWSTTSHQASSESWRSPLTTATSTSEGRSRTPPAPTASPPMPAMP